jgi:hypothetical protein
LSYEFFSCFLLKQTPQLTKTLTYSQKVLNRSKPVNSQSKGWDASQKETAVPFGFIHLLLISFCIYNYLFLSPCERSEQGGSKF